MRYPVGAAKIDSRLKKRPGPRPGLTVASRLPRSTVSAALADQIVAALLPALGRTVLDVRIGVAARDACLVAPGAASPGRHRGRRECEYNRADD